MNLSIYLSEEALQEEIEAFLFYEAERSGLGERFLKEVEKALQKISDHSTHYSYSDETKTIRDVSRLKFPFIVIYEVKPDRVEVYHIHHTKQELK